MNRKARIEALLKANVGWAESDRKFLEECDEAVFTRIHDNYQYQLAMKTNMDAMKVELDTLKTNVEKISQPKTLEDFIASAPAEMRGALAGMKALHGEWRKRLVAMIKSNAANTFSDEDLAAMSDTMLKKIADLAPVKRNEESTDFSGQPVLKANASEDERQARGLAPVPPAFPVKA